MKTTFNNLSGNNSGPVYSAFKHVNHVNEILTPKTQIELMLGSIPDISEVCRDLFNTFAHNQAPYTALQFSRVLQNFELTDPIQILRFMNNQETNHVLIHNDLLKVVLIHWKPGKISSIHGHPAGGCVFKVLQGSVEELRYTSDDSPKLLARSTYQAGAMAYIDDDMAYHAVGNPFDESAISIHAYTPGKK